MTRVVAVKLKDHVVELIDEIARASGLSRAEVIRHALLFCLNTDECLKGLRVPEWLAQLAKRPGGKSRVVEVVRVE
jgi:predicted transcriptional regulator